MPPYVPMTPEQHAQVKSLLQQGDLTTKEIAEKVGVTPGQVSAVKAHMTMGTYDASPLPAETDEVTEAFETTFGLERDLQMALRANIEQLEPGLKVIDGGHERKVPGGRIDILAQDTAGALVVIELKAGKAAPDALTQTLAYMGAIDKEPGQHVRGLLVAGDFHERIVYASRAVPNIQLRKYRFSFSFDSVQ